MAAFSLPDLHRDGTRNSTCHRAVALARRLVPTIRPIFMTLRGERPCVSRPPQPKAQVAAPLIDATRPTRFAAHHATARHDCAVRPRGIRDPFCAIVFRKFVQTPPREPPPLRLFPSSNASGIPIGTRSTRVDETSDRPARMARFSSRASRRAGKRRPTPMKSSRPYGVRSRTLGSRANDIRRVRRSFFGRSPETVASCCPVTFEFRRN